MISLNIPEGELTIHDVTGGNVTRLEALSDLFVELFPQYAHRLPLLHQRAQRPADANPLFVEHQWLVDIDNRAAAMTVFKYAPKRDLGLGVYLAVKPAYRQLSLGRHGRLAELLVTATREQLRVDALAAQRPTPAGYVVEVEVPKLFERYKAYGFVELPVEYFEPHFGQGSDMVLDSDKLVKVQFRRAQLGIFPLDGVSIQADDPILLSNAVKAFFLDHYGLPQDHWVVRCALESI